MCRWLIYFFLILVLLGCAATTPEVTPTSENTLVPTLTPIPPTATPPNIPKGVLPEPVYLAQAASVYAVAFSPKNDMLAGGDIGGKITLWNWRTGTKIKEWQVDDEPQLSLANFSPDGTQLATCSYTNNVKVWDIESTRLITTLDYKCSQNIGLGSVVYSPDGKFLVAGSGNDAVKFWDVSNWKEVKSIPINAAKLKFSPDGSMLVIADTAGYIYFWDLEEDTQVNKIKISAIFASGLAISPDGTKLAVKINDGRLILLKIPTGEIIFKNTGVHRNGWDVAYSPDGSLLASSDSNGNIVIWDGETGELISTYTSEIKPAYTDIFFSPDGSALAVASSDDAIHLWRFEK